MPKLNPIALCVICAFSVGGCASDVRNDAARPDSIEPVFSVNHGGFSAEQMYRMARSFESQRRYEQAIAAYREALKRKPLMLEAYTGLGMALAAEKRYEDAIRQFQAAVVLAPANARFHNNLGYAQLLAGRYPEAVQSLEEAQRLDGSNAAAHENLRLAKEQLAQAGAVAHPATTSPTSPADSRDKTTRDIRLVQIEPQVYELKMPPAGGSIVAKALPPMPRAVPQATNERSTPVASARPFGLEVSNGNGVTGMAKRVTDHLRRLGMPVSSLTNDRTFKRRQTLILYRSGYEAEALALKANLQPDIQTARSNELARHINVRLVLGHDVLSDSALVVPTTPAKLASR